MTLPTKCIYHVSKWYLKTCRKKARKTSQNPKRAKIIAKIPKIWFLQKTELMSRSMRRAIYVPNLRNLPWFIRPRLQKLSLTYIWLQTRSKWPNCDETQTRHVVSPTKCIYQVSIWYLKACWKKVRKTRTDGRTDGQTDGHCHSKIRPFSNGHIKMNLVLLILTNWSQQATGLDAWASRVKCPARFVSHLHDICIYMSCL